MNDEYTSRILLRLFDYRGLSVLFIYLRTIYADMLIGQLIGLRRGLSLCLLGGFLVATVHKSLLPYFIQGWKLSTDASIKT